MKILAQYIWIDGVSPTQSLRGKTRVIDSSTGLQPSTAYDDVADIPLEHFPEWGADGSSTSQAEGESSDIKLVPVRAVRDPFRPGGYLVLCEVFTAAGEAHPTNHRAKLRQALSQGAESVDAWFGYEQEYTLMASSVRPLGFPEDGYPGPQGPYYCAVGTSNIAGRKFYEDFIQRTIDSGLGITGYNWEVMPGQAEIQVLGDALGAPDHLWLTRWLLHRTTEDHDVSATLDPKPASGDWNGAGMHTNFSTAEMRADGGIKAIIAACEAIGEKVDEHLSVYGDGYERRLTGAHETAAYHEFSFGHSDRTASIRIPHAVTKSGKGYLEDRRPNANACPYLVADRLLRTVCGIAG